RNTFDVNRLQALDKNTFDGSSQKVSLTDPVANSSGFVTDARGQVTSETDPNGRAITTLYDDAGRVTRITDRLGRKREFTYYDNNLVHTEVWKDASNNIDNTIMLTYNENNQVLTATDNNGTYTSTYDDLGRVATRQDPWGITLTNTWDAADRLTQVTDTKGGTLTLDYDNANRNTVRKFSDGTTNLRLDIVYNNRNDVTEVDRYSDLAGTTLVGKTLYTLDDAGRVTAITHKNASNTT